MLLAVSGDHQLLLAQAGGGVSGKTVSDVMSDVQEWRLPLLGGATVLVLILMWVGDVIKPGSIQRAGPRDVSPFLWPVWLFGALVVFLSWMMAADTLRQQEWLTGPRVEGEVTSWADPVRAQTAVVGGSYLIAMIVGGGMVYLMSRSAPAAGLKFAGADIPIGVGCFLLALPVVLFTSDAVMALVQAMSSEGTPPPDPIAHETLDLILMYEHDPWVWGLIAAVVIGAPIVEEIIFRAFLQSALMRWFGAPWVAIITTSLLFTAIHYSAVPHHALPTLFVLSASMGLAFERSKRLGVPILMHMCFNAFNIALLLYGGYESGGGGGEG